MTEQSGFPPPSQPPASPPPVPVAPSGMPPGQPMGQPIGQPPGGAWPPPSGMPPGLAAPAGIRYAGALPRVLAWVLDGIIVGLIAGVIAAVLTAFVSNQVAAAYINAIITIGLELLYFVGFWTSGAQATLGMRLFNLTIGNAADGRELEIGPALLRWVALGLPFQGFSFLPAPLNALGALVTLWWIVLLITTIVSPTKQGLHDRIANTAIVQPIGREGPVLACLILLALLIVLPVIAFIGLIAIGTQVTSIITTMSPAP